MIRAASVKSARCKRVDPSVERDRWPSIPVRGLDPRRLSSV